MSTQQRDPIFESLDRLAGLADTDPVCDRMPDIRRRVRVARRRKGAGVLAVAAVLAVGGLGVWQSLPTERTAPPVVTPNTSPWQKVVVDAAAQDKGHLRISFSVTGRSTAYADPATGKPAGYAGPASTEVLVDGRLVTGSDGGAMACRAGGALTSYSTKFHTDEPLVVPVTAGGEHTVVVRAPYCAEGEIVPDTGTVSVPTTGGAFTSEDTRDVDVDGDGTKDVVELLVPNDADAVEQVLQVTWGTGGTTTVGGIPATMAAGLLDPADLDGDGDLELVVLAGGGDTSESFVFQAEPKALTQVRTVDADGNETPLTADADPSAWQTHVGSDGVVSYRLTDPTGNRSPAPADVRTWQLVGDTLTESGTSQSRCVTLQPTVSIGDC